MKTLLTTKQRQVLRVIIQGDTATESGERIPVDMNRLLELIPYQTSKQSMQFTVRALIKNCLIMKVNYECRRGRQRVVFEATDLAKQIMGGPKAAEKPEAEPRAPSFAEDLLDSDDPLLQEISDLLD